jgi:hypothetical protein
VKADGETGRRTSGKPAGEADSLSLAKADLARELNTHIRAIGSSLTEAADACEELTFYCECGCLSPLHPALTAFDAAGGALREGHHPPESAS